MNGGPSGHGAGTCSWQQATRVIVSSALGRAAMEVAKVKQARRVAQNTLCRALV